MLSRGQGIKRKRREAESRSKNFLSRPEREKQKKKEGLAIFNEPQRVIDRLNVHKNNTEGFDSLQKKNKKNPHQREISEGKRDRKCLQKQIKIKGIHTKMPHDPFLGVFGNTRRKKKKKKQPIENKNKNSADESQCPRVSQRSTKRKYNHVFD